MIFVLFGTQDAHFDRLLQLVKELAEDRAYSGEIVIQSGVTPVEWTHPNVRSAAFFKKDEFDELFQKADLIITHGGAGTMFEAIRAGKKTLAVPRLAAYGEHIDDHQVELTEELARLGYLEVYHSGDLKDAVMRLENKVYKKYTEKTDLIEYIVGRFQ